MENPTNEQITAAVYVPPTLVELGEFNEDTLGIGPRISTTAGTVPRIP